MSENPFEAIRKLGARMEQIAKDLDLELVQYALVPDKDGTNNLSAIFHITPEAVKTAAEIEQDQTDDLFADLIGGLELGTDEEGNIVLEGPDTETEAQEKAEVDEKERARLEREEQAKKNMQKWIKGEADEI